MINTKLILSIIMLIGVFQTPKNIQKKVAKEIKMAFEIETFSLETFEVSKEINTKLPVKITDKNFHKIIVNTKTIGYAFIDKAPSKTDQFDYVVLFNKDLHIKKAKVLVYREDYGGEIGSKRWLKQFIGKTITDKLLYKKNIIAISGATISATSMTVAVNNIIKTIAILHQNNLL